MLGKIWVKRNFGQQNFVKKKHRVENLIINIVCKYQNIILWLGVYWLLLALICFVFTLFTNYIFMTHRFILKIISAHVMIFAVLVMIVPVYITVCKTILEGVIQLYQGHYALITYISQFFLATIFFCSRISFWWYWSLCIGSFYKKKFVLILTIMQHQDFMGSYFLTKS